MQELQVVPGEHLSGVEGSEPGSRSHRPAATGTHVHRHARSRPRGNGRVVQLSRHRGKSGEQKY